VTLTILEGSTFCICDDIGDLNAGGGLFADDTRFLSRFELTIDGERPLSLSSGRVEYFSAAFYLRNRPGSRLEQDTLAIARERFVGPGLTEVVRVHNVSMSSVSFDLSFRFAADFADVFSVKQHDFALGDPLHAQPLPPAAEGVLRDERQLVLSEPGGLATTQVLLGRPAQEWPGGVCYPIVLAPGASWEVRLDVVPSLTGELVEPPTVEARFGTERAHVRESLAAWHVRIPRLRASWRALERTIAQSVADLAALRLRAKGTLGRLPAAGMPWFMTVFGRDTIITCLQTMLFGPELARSALEALAALQSHVDDPEIDAEPGKIIHELRVGRAAETWFPVYYGTLDATPLYLILLSETWRWTGDDELARSFRDPALRALEWIDRYGDRDGDGFVEYERRTPRGLVNQSWKDSGDSQRFADGTLAMPPIAPAEVQGYVYDAKLRTAELARDAWDDEPLAERLEREAAELRTRFDAAYWLDARGGYFALALDAEKRPVDSLCSNIGHLLWSGIVRDDRVEAVVRRLVEPALWSGWGIRTMSTADAGYSPISYHNGTVWPHDTSLAAWGLANCGRHAEAHAVVKAVLEAAGYFEWSLPEVFAGFDRKETPFPISYPTAARPQAWAAGAPVLLLRVLLGLRPDRATHRLVSDAPAALPDWAGSLELTSVPAFGSLWNVVVENGTVRVEKAP
jgi:glycogen debranching enzyme